MHLVISTKNRNNYVFLTVITKKVCVSAQIFALNLMVFTDGLITLEFSLSNASTLQSVHIYSNKFTGVLL